MTLHADPPDPRNLDTLVFWALLFCGVLDIDYPSARPMYNEQTLELGVRHTLAFVVFASGMLLMLFFFNLGLAVTLLFCLSATTATATVAVLPLMRRFRSMLVDYGVLWNGELNLARAWSILFSECLIFRVGLTCDHGNWPDCWNCTDVWRYVHGGEIGWF